MSADLTFKSPAVNKVVTTFVEGMKSETFSFTNNSPNGPEVDFVGGIEIEATNDILSVIMTGADRAGGEEELNRNLEYKSLDSETSGIDIHKVDAMLLEIMTDYSTSN
eukprot:5087239-Ditylum_brightwellii.AAC.2